METIERSEILCILVNKRKEEYVSIINDSGHFHTEYIANDRKPFGLNLDEVEENSMFMVTTESMPGRIITTIDILDINHYTDLLNNQNIVNEIVHLVGTLEILGEDLIDNLYKRVQVLRDRKLEKIVNG